MPFTREPSFRRASTSGTDSSMRRPSGATMRFITCIICSLLRNLYLVRMSLPAFSIYTLSKALTMISVTDGSRISSSSGPRPRISSSSSLMNFTRCSRVRGLAVSLASRPFMMPSTRLRVSWFTAASSEIFTRSVSSAVTTLRCTFILSSSQKGGTSTLASVAEIWACAWGVGAATGASLAVWRQSMSEPCANSAAGTLETHCFSAGLSSARRPSSTRRMRTHWVLGCSAISILFWLA